MFRLPNPGSNIDNFINIYQFLYSELEEREFEYFTLDDMSLILTTEKHISSQGYTGKEALVRSTRKDRSRDPVYNQVKMYAEIYRRLGWIQSYKDTALQFIFTYLGMHMAKLEVNKKKFFRECILGINEPNQIINSKKRIIIRPFVSILKAISDLDGYICRDEMIIGPLSNPNDLDENNYQNMIRKIRNCRPDYAQLQEQLQATSKMLGIKPTTLGNYTRFVISTLVYCDWVEKVNEIPAQIYSRNSPFLKLTSLGQKTVENIKTAEDIRYIEDLQLKSRASLVKVSFFEMLERGGFDVDSEKKVLKADYEIIKKDCGSTSLLFSPYQTYKYQDVDSVLNDYIFKDTTLQNKEKEAINGNKVSESIDYSYYIKTEKIKKSNLDRENDLNTFREIERVFRKNEGDLDTSVNEYHDMVKNYNKDEYYPLVVDLFNLLGLDSEIGRDGVNSHRFDAIIKDLKHSIPVEIKSPGEEKNISVKAVRQALENKIILLSREAYPTDIDSVSLVVGYNAPEKRAEVATLIEDIKTTFGFKIALFDFKTLMKLVMLTIYDEKGVDFDEFRKSQGIIQLEN